MVNSARSLWLVLTNGLAACKLEIFDCNSPGNVPKEFESRMRVHKYCLGSKKRANDDPSHPYFTWPQLVSYLKVFLEGSY